MSSRIIKPNPQGIVVPKRFIKEELDRVHREDWADPERYLRQKQKALAYIPVRARDLPDVTKLISEVKRVFHDDLATDPEIREAAQRAVWTVQLSTREAERDGLPQPASTLDPSAGPIKAGEKAPRGEVRNVDETDGTLEDLEWQKKEEDVEP